MNGRLIIIVHIIDVYTSLVYPPLLKYLVVRLVLYNNLTRTIFSCKNITVTEITNFRKILHKAGIYNSSITANYHEMHPE